MMRHFSTRVLHARQPPDEPVARVDHHQLHADPLERDPQQLRLALAHEAVVDVDAGQLVADGPMHEVAATALSTPPDSAQITWPGPRPLANLGHGGLDQVLRQSQFGRTPAMPTTKLRSTSRPTGVWTTSGWNWMP